jgi:hypothetical protein
MAVLEDLKGISVKINSAIKIHLRERFHWDFVRTLVFLLVVFIFEAQIVFHGTPRIFCLVIDARAEGRGVSPISEKYRECRDEGDEESHQEPTFELP